MTKGSNLIGGLNVHQCAECYFEDWMKSVISHNSLLGIRKKFLMHPPGKSLKKKIKQDIVKALFQKANKLKIPSGKPV